jgi:tetratricopeptide (TPR) repeat protein
MIWMLRRLRGDFARWDRSTRIGFTAALVLLVTALIAALLAPPDARLPILLGAAALLIVLQITVLWGNRGMISAFTQAQRLYVEGDLVGARDLLESVRPRANARVLTLLGNTYRQLGQLDESEAVLSEAVDKAPNHYFPLYGFGRTLLSRGRYAEAVDAIQRALDLGAPSLVRVELGEAYYRLSQPEAALDALHSVAGQNDAEPYRVLMAAYLLYRLGEGAPPSTEMLIDGLPYWEAAAERFRETPYGTALLLDIGEMVKLADGGGVQG